MYQFKVTIVVRFQSTKHVDRVVWVGLAETAAKARSLALANSVWGGQVVACVALS